MSKLGLSMNEVVDESKLKGSSLPCERLWLADLRLALVDHDMLSLSL